MILIMSSENDYSTIDVSKWLKYYNAPFIRIDGENYFKIENIQIGEKNDFLIFNNTKEVLLFSNIKSVWYRRGILNLSYLFDSKISHDISLSLKEHLTDELKIIKDYFYFLMKQRPHLGTFDTRGMNKLIVLYQANSVGIQIPETFICESLDKFKNYNHIITKSISEVFNPKTK